MGGQPLQPPPDSASDWPAAAASFMHDSALSQPAPLSSLSPQLPGSWQTPSWSATPASGSGPTREAAAERELQGLHLALSTCSAQRDALQRKLKDTEQKLQQQLVEVTEQRDRLQLRLEVAQNQLGVHAEREAKEDRLEKSVRLRRELGEQAEKALLLAQERIAKLTQDLDHAMQRIQELEAADVARVAEMHEAQAGMVRRSEEAKREAAAEARRKAEEEDRQTESLVALEQENAKMREHLTMLTSKITLLEEQTQLGNEEMSIVVSARDKARAELEETQTQMGRLKAEMAQEAEARAQQQVQEHLRRQVWLETALRTAFVQESKLRQDFREKERGWTEYAGALRATVSKQARLLSLRQVSALTSRMPAPGVAQVTDSEAKTEAGEAAAVLEAEAMRLQAELAPPSRKESEWWRETAKERVVENAAASGGWDADDDPFVSAFRSYEELRSGLGEEEGASDQHSPHAEPPATRFGAAFDSQDGSGEQGRGSEAHGAQGNPDGLRAEAHKEVIEDLVGQLAEAVAQGRSREAEMTAMKRAHGMEAHRLQAYCRAADAQVQQLERQLREAADAAARAGQDKQVLTHALAAVSGSAQAAHWAKNASSSQVLGVLEQARTLKQRLVLADDAVRQLREAALAARMAGMALRKNSMHERARLGRREYVLENRVQLLHRRIERTEEELTARDQTLRAQQDTITILHDQLQQHMLPHVSPPHPVPQEKGSKGGAEMSTTGQEHQVKRSASASTPQDQPERGQQEDTAGGAGTAQRQGGREGGTARDSNDVSSEAEVELCRVREQLRAAEEGRENAEVRAAELSRELTAALSAVDAHTKQCAALEARVQQEREAGEQEAGRLRAELEVARGEADAAEMARLVRELARQDANCDQLNVLLEQARRLGEEERERAFVMSETMDKMREENRDLFRNLNNARAQVQEERRLMGVLRDEMGGVQKMLDDCRDELASSRDRGVMLSERSRRAKLALEDTLRVVHEVELRIKQIQIQVHEFTDTLRRSNLAELMLAFHKAHHPEDRVDPARYKGLTNALQRDIKEYLTGNVRAYGTSMGQESKTLHTISKLLNKTVSGMV